MHNVDEMVRFERCWCDTKCDMVRSDVECGVVWNTELVFNME